MTALQDHRKVAEEKEDSSLFELAAKSKTHSRYSGPEDDHRLPYKRDVDRIVHSKGYTRYIDKTQVAYLVDNDHITHRVLHVQLVANFARGVAEILRLNCDLVEAIGLGHDVGHPPFGHEGEEYLSELSIEFGAGAFAHSAQSCRLFRDIEPLNLGLAVYDGFLTHDGGMRGNTVEPNFGKTWDDHFQEIKDRNANPEIAIRPATLEGCLVRLSDTVSYLGRDIEDAIRMGLIKRSDVPKTKLGNTNREILSHVAQDIISESYEKPYIAFSEAVFADLKVLRKFNFEAIYLHQKLKVESEKIKRAYRILFELLLEEYHQSPESSHLHREFLANKPESYVECATPVQKVVDYLSGMTDSYFLNLLRQLVVPTRIEL